MGTKKNRWFLWPFSLLYGIGVFTRNKLFDWGVLKTCSFDIPIICIGNITVGGTGKTPHTEALISILKENYSVACLSRGYKRKTSGFVLASQETTAEEIGDEPRQIKMKFPGIIVAVDSNRKRGIQNLLRLKEKPDVIIMDDGFQHRYVKADINILLIDYHRPIHEDHLLPRGMLRESPAAIKRANYIFITKCPPGITPLEERIILKDMKLKSYQELLFTTMKYGDITPLDGTSHCWLTTESVVLCVTGIAQPAPYIAYLSTLAGGVIHHDYPDHHYFTEDNIKRIVNEFDQINAPRKYIFMTEKDATRVTVASFPEEIQGCLFYIPIEPKFLNPQERLLKNIHDYVRKDKRM